jgi:hypothetical protein
LGGRHQGGAGKRVLALGQRVVPGGFRLGLALLERRGVAAGARLWWSTAPQPGGRPVVEAPAGGDEIAGVLATMALACLAAR